MRMKRIFAMLLAFALVLGGIPAAGLRPLLSLDAQAAEVVKPGYTINETDKTYKITGPEGWAALDGECWPKNQGMPGWKVTLEKDITIPAGLIPSVDDFKGSFDGQGHFIKIGEKEKESRFSNDKGSGMGADIGLFRNLLESAKVQNLIVWNEGTLKASALPSIDITSYGALVGRMSENATLQNCALIGNGTVSHTRNFYGGITSVGSMVGRMEGSSKIDGCYSEASVFSSTARLSETGDYLTNVAGGIVGQADMGSPISNSAYRGKQIRTETDMPNINYNYAGGIAGARGVISNCYVDRTYISCRIGAYGVGSGHFGCISTVNNPPTNSYSSATFFVDDSSADMNTRGQCSSINNIDASMMGSAWADTAAGVPNLKWLVTKGPEAAVNLAGEGKLSMTPAYMDYNGTEIYESGADSLWKFDATIPLKGRTAPLTADATLHKATGASTVIKSVAVSDNSNTSGTYYSGLSYPFLATITGTHVVGNILPDKLIWAASAKPISGVATDASTWWSKTKKGTLDIPAEFYGDIDVTATYDGKVSKAKTLSVERGVLAMANKSVLPGTTVPMELTLNASLGVFAQVGLPNVTWALSDSSKGITIDNSGVLTVAANATGPVTVTATVAGMAPAEATVTVDPLTNKEVTIDLTGATADVAVPGTQTLALGESVTMTVTPYDAGANSTYAWTGSEDAGSETTASHPYTPKAAGTFTFTATQTVTSKTEPPVVTTYTAVFTITVKDSSVPWKETEKTSPTQIDPSSIKGTDEIDSGGGPATSYSITLPTATNVSYYYKLVDATDLTGALSQTYLSTSDLTKAGYQVYTTDINSPVKGNAFQFPHLLVVAVDADIGNKLPSAVTQFNLLALPTVDSRALKCENPAAPGAVSPTTGKLTAFYSIGLTDAGTPPSATDGLPLNTILLNITTGVPLPPQSVEYIATGDIKVTAWPVKDRFGNDADKSCFVETTSGGATKGDIAPKPTIYPRANGIITGGVTIRVPSGGTVLYTATPNVVVPVIPEVNMETGKPKAGSTTKLYQAGEEIPFPDAATSFVVCAVTWISGNSLSDFDYVLYKNDANLLTPDAPELLLNGIKYSSSATYPGDGAVSFNHADLLNGEVLFTVNGETPTAGLYNTKTYLPKGGDGIGSFDPTKPYKLTGSSEFITIKAKFHDKKKLLDSPVATYLISVKQMLSAPVASLETDTMVRPGASLNLSLSDDALKQLNSNGKIRVERTTYQAGTDGKDGTDGTDNFPTGAKIKLTGDPPEVGTDYVSYYLDSDSQGYALPSIRYLFGDDTSKMASDGILCRYGQRRVLTVSTTTNNVITTEVTVTYRNPQPIALTGTAGQQLKVHAMAVSGVEAHSDSNLVTFRYTIRGSVATPVAFPATDPNKPVSVNIGDRIALSTETADAQIFYTTDGSEPKATYTPPAGTTPGKWEPQEPTKLYDETKSITMADNEQLLFTVRAFAVSKNFSLENSPSVMFRYQPPAPVQAVFTSPSQGAVVANQPVVLKCTTADAKIFYKIFTSKPSLSDKANIPQPYIDQIFDSTVPIVITKPTWIIAIAERSGVLSKPTLNEYTVATQLPDPYASLKTGSVVYKGTRIRLNGSGNLAFTVDGSDPKAALAAQQTPVSTDKDAKKAEVLYGDSVVIDAEYGKSVTIRAFAYGEGRSPSNTVSFTYTVCDKDAYLTAAPAAGSVVTSGDNITLTTGISGGMVFYSVGSNTPTLINRFEDDRYNDDWTDADWDDDYTHYQWRNGSSTRKGNSVKVTGEPGSTFTVKATAAANGSEGGTTGVFTYSIRSRTSAPTASIPSGAVVFDGAAVTLSAQEGDIFYTTDGTAPSTSSRLYSAPIPVTGSMVLKAIAVAKDKVESNAVEYIYSYADQAFAPSMSLPGGEIEQGSRIELSTQTEGATIYYSTNGVDPTKESTLYTSPIIVMRPVTIKSIAMRKDLRDSAVNSASYTVIEPELPPMDETDSTGKPQTTLDSLVSRRTYFDENSGPRFTDVIINDPETSTVLSANEGNVSKRAKLVVKQINSSDSDQEAVRNALGYQIVTLYDVSLVQDGEKVQPQGEVEIGIPIPGDYQNGVVTICRVGVDNTVEEYKPRRSGNNAYITVEGNLDRYAVTVPAMSGNISGRLSGWQIALICGAGVLFAGGIGLSVFYFLKKRRENSDD